VLNQLKQSREIFTYLSGLVVYIFQSNILLLPSNAPISFASQKGVDNRHIFSGVDAVFS